MNKTVLALVLSIATLAGACAPGFAADNYPNGPVQVIIPTKPGGDADSSGRLLAKDGIPFFGKTLVPVNIDGGGGNLALQQVMGAPADGMILLNHFSYANAIIGGRMKYNWEDVTPVAIYAKNDTQIFCVSGDAPYKNAQELAKAIRENPRSVSFSVTLGSPSHYHAVAFEQAAGGKFKKVDIGSGADKTVSLLSGEVNVISSTVGIMKDYLASGQVIAIGAITAERSAFAPDIPTMKEQGINIGDVGFAVHYTVWMKAGTPRAIIDKAAGFIEKMVASDTFKQDCKNMLFTPVFMGPEEAAAYQARYYAFLDAMKPVIQTDTF